MPVTVVVVVWVLVDDAMRSAEKRGADLPAARNLKLRPVAGKESRDLAQAVRCVFFALSSRGAGITSRKSKTRHVRKIGRAHV